MTFALAIDWQMFLLGALWGVAAWNLGAAIVRRGLPAFRLSDREDGQHFSNGRTDA